MAKTTNLLFKILSNNDGVCDGFESVTRSEGRFGTWEHMLMTREGCGQPGPHLSVAHTLQHIITGGRGGGQRGCRGVGGSVLWVNYTTHNKTIGYLKMVTLIKGIYYIN